MVVDFLVVAAAQFDSGLSPAVAALIGAGIGSVTTLVGLGVNAWTQRGKEEREAKRARADTMTEQLSKLYGPLRLLTVQSRALAGKLREGKPEAAGWHLLDHLSEVVADKADLAIAEQIIAVNRKIEELIFAHAGLLKDGDVPQSFVDFLGHHRFMSTAFAAAKSSGSATREFTAKRFEYYPKEFDADVEDAYNELVSQRRALLEH